MLLAQDTLPASVASWGRTLTGADYFILVSYFVLMLGHRRSTSTASCGA